MTERKLASIRRIKEIREIPGADRIVCAVVDGWELVTQKANNFKPGDLVVYFEIDSLLPICDQFSFLEQYRVSAKNSVNGEGYRLKTIKLRGQISQGLILPLEEALSGLQKVVDVNTYAPVWLFGGEVIMPEEGVDLTEYLGIKKYEKPIPAQLAGRIRGNFPSFIRKTDQERIQNCFDKWFDKWKDHEFEVTLKLDGSSFTAYVTEERFGVCSRNLDLIETEDNTFWQVARKYDLENKMKAIGYSFAIQGELMGPGVQGNRERFEELDIYIFDIFDIEKQRYVGAFERWELCEKLGLKHVPIIDVSEFHFTSVKEFLRYAERPSINHKQAEGVVFKSISNPDISFKAISNAFLMDEE